jgi:hypothetical protein
MEKADSGPFFGLPKWDINSTLPPSLDTFKMVLAAALIRVSSVTSKASFKGTLKSTRIKTRLPEKFT